MAVSCVQMKPYPCNKWVVRGKETNLANRLRDETSHKEKWHIGHSGLFFLSEALRGLRMAVSGPRLTKLERLRKILKNALRRGSRRLTLVTSARTNFAKRCLLATQDPNTAQKHPCSCLQHMRLKTAGKPTGSQRTPQAKIESNV